MKVLLLLYICKILTIKLFDRVVSLMLHGVIERVKTLFFMITSFENELFFANDIKFSIEFPEF